MTILKYIKASLIFLLTLLGIGLAFGTYILQLLIKSLVIYIRKTGWFSENENIMTITVILFFTFFLILISKWLTKWFMASTNRKTHTVYIVVLLLCYAASAAYWLIPSEIRQNKVMLVSRDGRFIGGPYPDRLMMSKLKGADFTAVVSLLDPLMLPSEPRLIMEEEKSAQEAGIPLIRIPMLPGNVKNLVAENQIAALIKHPGQNRYYVHAYYGHDRLVMFMNIVNSLLKPIKLKQLSTNQETPAPQPSILGMNIPQLGTLNLERGTAVKLDNHVIVAPKLTDSEYVNLITNDKNRLIGLPIQSIVSINTDDSANSQAELIKLLDSNGIKYYSMPIPLYPYDPEKVLNVVKKVKALPGGVMVYSYFMPPQSTVMSGFILSYLTNLPSLPKGLFKSESMTGGKVSVIAPNIAIGPRPSDNEFSQYLQPRGIRSIAYMGPCNGDDYNIDIQHAHSINMTWICFPASDELLYKTLSANGPWYVYGPDLAQVQTDLIQHFSKLDAEK
jgi:hypothetical protein